jgi:hypothetical protein
VRLASANARYIERCIQFLERIGRLADAWDTLSDWARRTSPPGEWTPESVSGKRVVLHRRIRGIGAEVRLARFISSVARDAASCTVVAEPRLAPLYARSFPKARVVVAGEPLAPAECKLGYEQAAALYGRSEQALRDGFVPLVADSEQVRAFREGYRSPGRRLVGLGWRSANERKRVPELEDWRPLLADGTCQFVSLQYGDVTRDLAALNAMAARPLIVDPSVDQLTDMDRFAAQVAALDAVVLISCTAAHLSGALAQPTIVLFHEDDTQAWQHDRDDSPWYPALRILQKRSTDSWSAMIGRAARELAPGGFLNA